MCSPTQLPGVCEGTDGVRKRKGGEKWKRDPCACLPVEDLTSAAVYK